MTFPNISIVIPTLNSGKALKSCLKSIKLQKYLGTLEILIIDGGSTDDTLDIAKKYECKILNNPLKTAEAGKSVGVKNAKFNNIALIDSDNILPSNNWLSKMIAPLTQDMSLIGSEPLSFSYRPKAGFIERYSALIGVNDPYAYFTGNYDRFSFLSQKWTGLNIKTTEFPSYLKITLTRDTPVPTIGANGTIFRKSFLLANLDSDYLFDVDIISRSLAITNQPLFFAKVKTSIVHTFCESSIFKFIRKQQRRVNDLYFYKPYRRYPLQFSAFSRHNLGFGLYSLSIIFPLIDSVRGFLHKKDIAWFFHPIACLLTIFIYIQGFLKNSFGLNTKYNRLTWHQ